MKTNYKPGVLLLEDGTEFSGLLLSSPASHKNFGYGEVVFNTSMTGYQEILTDPSYYGQIVCFTHPHIGNTGINLEDPESARTWCSGLLVNHLCDEPSSWRMTQDLNSYLLSHHIPGLFQVNTRALTVHLRSKGVLRGVLLPESEKAQGKNLLLDLPPFEGRDLICEVSTRKPFLWNSKKESSTEIRPEIQIVALDFGIKFNLLRSLEKWGCRIEVVPAQTTAQEIIQKKPDGVFLSNGPGDPSAAPYAVETVRQLLGRIPLFGVCMGHQILALALGAKTYKLRFGHRGVNQPVLDRSTGRIEISSHNHGYAVDANSLPTGVEITHINLNDQTVEGLRVKGIPAFSVQYHPEACPGPHDSLALFEQFIHTIKGHVPKIS